jgi:hypothetical protein
LCIAISEAFSVRVKVNAGKILRLRDPNGSSTRDIKGPMTLQAVKRRIRSRGGDIWIIFPSADNFGLPIREDPERISLPRDLQTAWDNEVIEQAWTMASNGRQREIF